MQAADFITLIGYFILIAGIGFWTAKKVKNKKRAHGKIKFRAQVDYDAFRMDRSDPTVKLAVKSAKALGLKPKTVAVDGGLDANYLNQLGVPTVMPVPVRSVLRSSSARRATPKSAMKA